MKDEEIVKKLAPLLAVRRPEEFWRRQKKNIIGAAPGHSTVSGTWLLVPAAAAAALVIFLAREPRGPAPEARAVSPAFLEHLDLLSDMDVLEAVPEKEL